MKDLNLPIPPCNNQEVRTFSFSTRLESWNLQGRKKDAAKQKDCKMLNYWKRFLKETAKGKLSTTKPHL